MENILIELLGLKFSQEFSMVLDENQILTSMAFGFKIPSGTLEILLFQHYPFLFF